MTQENGLQVLQPKLVDWWRNLDQNKGERAALRRCAEPPSLIHHARVFVGFYREAEEVYLDEMRLMPILGLLSHVKSHDEERSIAAAMAQSKNESPIVSELRFQRLLQSRDRKELYPLLLRGIKLLGNNVNVNDLIKSVYFWGDSCKKRWAFDYYRRANLSK